jgi:hypothetical protein
MRIAVSTAIALAVPSLYLYFLHRRLSRTTRHAHILCTGTDFLDAAGHEEEPLMRGATTVPNAVFTSNRYLVAYDRAWSAIHKTDLPSEEDLNTALLLDTTAAGSFNAKLLTAYLRRNMSAFARYLPQAYLLRMMLRGTEAAKTLDPVFIGNLDFVERDVVCGVYQVLRREDGIVEFVINQDVNQQPATTSEEKISSLSKQGFEGRMIIDIESMDDESIQIYSETIMWRQVGNGGVVMPLERRFLRALHELASWWLLESGVQYLRGLKGRK